MDDRDMVEGFAVMFFLLVVIVSLAIGVIVVLALVRRPAQMWQTHLREQNEQLTAPQPTDGYPEVSPTEASLETLMSEATTTRSAYFDADRLPGVDRIEIVTDKIEALQDKRTSSSQEE